MTFLKAMQTIADAETFMELHRQGAHSLTRRQRDHLPLYARPRGSPQNTPAIYVDHGCFYVAPGRNAATLPPASHLHGEWEVLTGRQLSAKRRSPNIRS